MNFLLRSSFFIIIEPNLIYMDLTWRQFLGDVSTSIKAISPDSYLPYRYLYYEAQSIIASFLKQDNDAKKKLSRISSGWSEIECIDLEETPTIACSDIDVRLCDKVMKSIHPLPSMYTYTYGNIIDHVASPNLAVFFNPTNPRQWNNIQKRQYKDKTKYYYFILDNYLYIPVPKNVDLPIENVRIKAYFMDKKSVDDFKYLKNCKDCSTKNNCKSILDYEVVIPSYLMADVKMELLKRLSGVYLKVVPDEYSNLNQSDRNSQRDLQNHPH